jgi:hypothetical protein
MVATCIECGNVIPCALDNPILISEESIMLKKLGFGPAIQYAPQAPGVAAKFITPEVLTEVKGTNPAVAEELSQLKPRWKRHGLITRLPKGTLQDQRYATGKQMEKAIMRHELTHAIRYKKGKFKNVGKPTLAGVLATTREELIGHRQMVKAIPRAPLSAKIRGTLVGTKESVKQLYPKGVLKALMKLR